MKAPRGFENLGPPEIANRYREVRSGHEPVLPPKSLAERAPIFMAEEPKPPPSGPTPEPSKHPGGRPPRSDKPWEKEGISKSQWYRRQKRERSE